MFLLTREHIEIIHAENIETFSGNPGYYENTRNKIESILAQQYPMFGYDKYPSIFEKAAMLMYFFVKGHCFVDGNKRVGILTMLIFLRINYIDIQCEDEDIIDLGLGIAMGKYNTAHIVEWISLYSQ